MTITIQIDNMRMHFCINIYNTKQLNRFERNYFTYLNYEDDFFNRDKYEFKVTIVVEM